MATRMNPKRRREMALAKVFAQALSEGLAKRTLEAKALNPTTQADVLTDIFGRPAVRSRAVPKALYGSSKGLAPGLVRLEANPAVFSQHKRRKSTKPAEHVNASDLERITTPDQVTKLDAPRPVPLPLKRIARPNKLVRKAKRSWSLDGYK